MYISAQEFKDYYFLIDDYPHLAWERTIVHFSQKHAPVGCQFEQVVFSKDELNKFVASSLIDDADHTTLHSGEEYIDWTHLASLASVVENFVVTNPDHYSVDDALSHWGLPCLKELENEYVPQDLSYKNGPDHKVYHLSFK